MHFGSRHWKGNDEMLLEKINSYAADIVINTGDNTTDALENEFKSARKFLHSIKCEHVISIAGNHDKRNMHSQDFFQEYINKVDLIYPQNPERCKKNKIFLEGITEGIKERFTDVNFLKKVIIHGKSILLVCLDTNELYKDNGYVDEEMLRSVSSEIDKLSYDQVILLNHHSILETDSDPLYNSNSVIEFIQRYNIQHVFCGHTHQLSLIQCKDLYNQHSFTQYKIGTLTSHSHPNDTNMFLYYENFGEKDMKINLLRIFNVNDQLTYKEEVIVTSDY